MRAERWWKRLLRLFQDRGILQLLVIKFSYRFLQIFFTRSKHVVHYSEGNDLGVSIVSHSADAADKVIFDLQHVVNHESAYAGPYH